MNSAIVGPTHGRHDPLLSGYNPFPHVGYGATRHDVHRSRTPRAYVPNGHCPTAGSA